MWLHASPNYIVDGGLISPPTIDRAPRWQGAEQAELIGWYRRDRVYVFWSDEGVPVRDHIGRFEFVTDSAYVYEVAPIGDLDDDPAPGGHASWKCCANARVLRCHLRPSN